MDYWLCPFNESVGFHWLLELNSALTSPLYYISRSSFLLTHWRKNTDMSATKTGKYFKIHPGMMVFKKGSGNRLVQFNSWNKHQVIWVVRLLSIKASYGQGVIALMFSVLQFDMLEMDRLERQLVNLPLLQDPSSYIPDTVDLTEDALAREYWLYCFEEALDGVGWRHSCNSRTNVVNICKIIHKRRGKNTMTKIKSEPSIRLWNRRYEF